jgi:hypothetical protein
MNLGWKLAATIHGKAPEGLLDSYGIERHPIGAQVLDWSRAQATIMKPDPNARALHAIITDLINTVDGATYFAGRVWGVSTQINLGGKHPLVGCSVPNFEFENGTKIGELMQDGRGILLDFNHNPSLQKLASEYSGQIDYISATAKVQLGLCAALIRPDGVIAWATDNLGDISELQEEIAKWFL